MRSISTPCFRFEEYFPIAMGRKPSVYQKALDALSFKQFKKRLNQTLESNSSEADLMRMQNSEDLEIRCFVCIFRLFREKGALDKLRTALQADPSRFIPLLTEAVETGNLQRIFEAIRNPSCH